MGVGENPPKSHDSAEILFDIIITCLSLNRPIVGSLRCMLGVGFVLLWDPKAAAGEPGLDQYANNVPSNFPLTWLLYSLAPKGHN
jgi:hypothetical protein